MWVAADAKSPAAAWARDEHARVAGRAGGARRENRGAQPRSGLIHAAGWNPKPSSFSSSSSSSPAFCPHSSSDERAMRGGDEDEDDEEEDGFECEHLA